jgi:hypothetical protein
MYLESNIFFNEQFMVLFIRAGGTGGKAGGNIPPPILADKLTLFQVMNFNDAFICVLTYRMIDYVIE